MRWQVLWLNSTVCRTMAANPKSYYNHINEINQWISSSQTSGRQGRLQPRLVINFFFAGGGESERKNKLCYLIGFSEVDNFASQIWRLYVLIKRQQRNPSCYNINPGIILLMLQTQPSEKSDVTLNNPHKLSGFYCLNSLNVKLLKRISLILKLKYKKVWLIKKGRII